eukprot:11187441-Lingulodinium_polyedra.AAC.1
MSATNSVARGLMIVPTTIFVQCQTLFLIAGTSSPTTSASSLLSLDAPECVLPLLSVLDVALLEYMET